MINEAFHLYPSEEELNELPQQSYTCTECSATFKNKVHLLFHSEKSHGLTKLKDTRVLPFTLKRKAFDSFIYHCPISSCRHHARDSKGGFRKYNKLKQHFEVAHMPKKFSCKRCQKAFQTPFLLKNHENTCGMRFVCPMCKRHYSLKKFIMQHFRRSHKDSGISIEDFSHSLFIYQEKPLDLSKEDRLGQQICNNAGTSTNLPLISRSVECGRQEFPFLEPWIPHVDNETQTTSFLRFINGDPKHSNSSKNVIDHACTTEPELLDVNTCTNGSRYDFDRFHNADFVDTLLDLSTSERALNWDEIDFDCITQAKGISCQTTPAQTKPQEVQVVLPSIDELQPQILRGEQCAKAVETTDFGPFDWSSLDYQHRDPFFYLEESLWPDVKRSKCAMHTQTSDL
ncbi:hypothetical protein Ciccas_002893 [Cichlidogyrus casuarinus]|uniref:C2H2-type domain-containing protein n=1 Tax=Cichlidogyrus casuarinus TaxID=1844966 RepID=A0ABD2QI91_9PLAT